MGSRKAKAVKDAEKGNPKARKLAVRKETLRDLEARARRSVEGRTGDGQP